MKRAPRTERERGSGFPAAFVAGLVVVLIVVGCLVLFSRHSRSARPVAQAVKLPFGGTEQAYAPRIHFDDVKLARATNLLGEEFTYVDLGLTNTGAQSIHGLSVTLKFYDPFKQVILQDSEQLVKTADPPLDPGKRRNLRITLGAIPETWNHEAPVFQVNGLILK